MSIMSIKFCLIFILALVATSTSHAFLGGASPPPPQPLNISRWANKRVMVITAHPDDAEGFAGGLIASLQAQGNVEVAYVITTTGNAGGQCYTSNGTYYDCPKEEISWVRRQESVAAAAFLGVHTVKHLGLDDGLTVAYHETRVRRAYTAYARAFKPHVIVTHYPYPNMFAPPSCNGKCLLNNGTKGWDDLGYHPDHQHVGSLAFNTAYGGGDAIDNDMLFEDIESGLPAWHGVEELYFFALTNLFNQPMTHYVELDDALLNAKITASALHKSQYTDGPPVEGVTWVANAVGKAANVTAAEGYTAFF